MHEYSIVSALIDRVEAEARARGATAVQRIRVRIGELAGVEPELFVSAYDLVREHTLCRDAELEVRAEEAQWLCPRCRYEIAPGQMLRCPRCQVAAELVGGGDIMLDQIEMEVP
jgi:hydrogenase nickel incorporation protein HypA/HybF